MRDVIMWNVVSLEGYFEGATKWDVGFLELVWGDELERFSIDQAKAADTILFGRVTYEGMAAHWPNETGEVADIMNSIDKVVFSRTLDRVDWNNTRLVNAEAADEVRRMKQETGRDILVFGSANLSASLIEHDLIDEFRICVAPVLIGKGTPLFQSETQRTLAFVGERELASGGVVLTYRTRRE